MTKREWQLAIPLLMGFALCLAAFVHGQQVANPEDGIAAMRVFKTQQGEHVAVVANHALYLLDAQGHQIARQDLKTLGLTERPNDMDWTVDDQQRVEAWFFDDSSMPRVLRCAWSPEQAQLVGCRTAMAGPQLKVNASSRVVHLAVDRMGRRVFIADGNANRVQSFDLDGKLLASTDPQAVPLLVPNRLRYIGDDTLVVADNDHHRLAWLRVASGQPTQLLRSLRAADHGQARAGRDKVTDAAIGPDGTAWMLAMKQDEKDGDVLVFDAQQRPVTRAALGDNADPIIIEALGSIALVADYSGVTLQRIDAQGRNLGEFGDSAFRAELKPLQDGARAGALWKQGALIVGAVVIVSGLVLGLLFGEKPKRLGQFGAQAKAGLTAIGIANGSASLRYPLVLPQTPAYRAVIRKQVWGLGLVAVLVVALALFSAFPLLALGTPPHSPGNQKTVLLILLALALPALTIGLAWRNLLQVGELRAKEDKLAWYRNGKRVCATPLVNVYASTNALLLGYTIIRFRTGSWRSNSGTAMFDMDSFNRAVLARIPPGHLVNDPALVWQSLRNRPLAHQLLMGSLVAAICFVYLHRLFR